MKKKLVAPVTAGKTYSELDQNEKLEILGYLSSRDAILAGLIEQVEAGGGLNIEMQTSGSSFDAILESIVYQQLTGKAAATIFNRLKEEIGTSSSCPAPEQILASDEAVLRKAGLSGAKIKAVKDLSEKKMSGLVPDIDRMRDMTDEDIISCLVAVRGVGRWTAHMFLIFRLGRLDVMPSGDYGVKKGFAITYGDMDSLPTEKELENHAECWIPYRSIASWYMWRAVDILKARLSKK